MQPNTKTNLYLASAVTGGVASIVLALANLFDWTGWLYGGPALVTIVSLLVILRRTLRDEYTQSLWQAGTSAAFVVLAILYFLVPFATGFIDGLAGREMRGDFPYELAAIGAFVAFYAGFLMAWLRSAR